MNRRLRRGLVICALTAAALTAPTLAWGASTTVLADTAWGNPPADGGTTNPIPAVPVVGTVTGTVTVTVDPEVPVDEDDTAWG
jgi:hypothetical protein